MKHSQELGFDDDGRPVLITRAAPAYEEQHRARVRKYLTLMAFRMPALILAAVAYSIWENGLVSLAIIAVSIPLPWIAVLIANDRPPRRAEEPRRYEAAAYHCSRPPNGPRSSSERSRRRNRTASIGTATFLPERRLAVFSDDSQVIGAKAQIRTCESTGSWELFRSIRR